MNMKQMKIHVTQKSVLKKARPLSQDESSENDESDQNDTAEETDEGLVESDHADSRQIEQDPGDQDEDQELDDLDVQVQEKILELAELARTKGLKGAAHLLKRGTGNEFEHELNSNDNASFKKTPKTVKKFIPRRTSINSNSEETIYDRAIPDQKRQFLFGRHRSEFK